MLRLLTLTKELPIRNSECLQIAYSPHSSVQVRPRHHYHEGVVVAMGEQTLVTAGIYDTDVSDMFAVHKAILGALAAAQAYVAEAGLDQARVDTIGSFNENVIEF